MVFNPALQSCDFYQTAPECRTPLPSPQKMSSGTQAKVRHPASPWTNPQPRFRSLIPQNRDLASHPTGLATLNMPAVAYQKPASLPRPSPLKSSPRNYGPTVKEQAHLPTAVVLEGFNPFEAVGIADGFINNRVNTGNPFDKPAHGLAQPMMPHPKLTAKKLGNTNPGAAVTVFEIECDGTVAYHIEPESGCR